MEKEMSTKMSVKLLIDKKTRRVLFVEGGKDFVDFLFSLLAMPLGSVVKLLTKKSMMGCIAELYKSVQNLDDMYMQTNAHKTSLLKPKTLSSFSCTHRSKLLDSSLQSSCKDIDDSTLQTPKYYTCSSSNHTYNPVNITAVKGTRCPSCGSGMNKEAIIIVPNMMVNTTSSTASNQGDGKEGYVKDVVTYMITDDLVVTPMSTISCFTLINKFSLKEISTLEERVVVVGIREGLKLLKASLESKMALTDAFLGKQSCPEAKGNA